MIVGRSEYSLRAASEALPMRDAFAVLFFVSVGMLLDPRFVLGAPGLIAATLAVVLVGKPLVALLVVLLLRYPVGVGLAVAVALAQIGEFSFILASLGVELGILPAEAMQTIVAVAMVSIVLNPLLYRYLPAVERWMAARGWTRPAAPATASTIPADGLPAHRAIIVGYGPTGRTLARLLRDNEIEPSVIELNMETVRRLRDEDMLAVYGDASHREALEAAGARTASSLLLTADAGDSREVIRVARELNPSIRVLARTAHLRDLRALRDAGVDEVFAGESEVAVALTEAVLRRLGATPEQIDRERSRARGELVG
jgi:CPA2 family monovalent cation:H+ antiporter-2